MSRFLLALKSSLKSSSKSASKAPSKASLKASFKNNPLNGNVAKGKKSAIQQITSQETTAQQIDNRFDDRSMVFDEIDVGVSGRVAQAIALQLWQLSQQSQVLCVTHQPIVAAIADHHFQVRKQVIWEQQGEVNQERTHIAVKALNDQERKQELAQIASGVADGQDLDAVFPNFEMILERAEHLSGDAQGNSRNSSRHNSHKNSKNNTSDDVKDTAKQATATQAIAFAESLLHQANILKTQLKRN